jgi:hypothetical protein
VLFLKSDRLKLSFGIPVLERLAMPLVLQSALPLVLQ